MITVVNFPNTVIVFPTPVTIFPNPVTAKDIPLVKRAIVIITFFVPSSKSLNLSIHLLTTSKILLIIGNRFLDKSDADDLIFFNAV